MYGFNYYAEGDTFPYPQGNGGPYPMFICRPNLNNPPFPAFPVAQPGAICASGSATMNFFRPNQAFVRQTVKAGGPLSGMGDSSISTPLLLGGLAVAGFAAWLALGPRRRMAF